MRDDAFALEATQLRDDRVSQAEASRRMGVPLGTFRKRCRAAGISGWNGRHPCRQRALAAAAARRQRLTSHTVSGVTGTLSQLCAHFSAVSERQARKRMTQFGMSVAEAVTVPAMPRARRRQLAGLLVELAPVAPAPALLAELDDVPFELLTATLDRWKAAGRIAA